MKQSKVAASNDGLIGEVNNEATVADVRTVPWYGRDVLVYVTERLSTDDREPIRNHLHSLCREVCAVDTAVFASEIADLACLRERRVATRSFATLEGVDVAASGATVAIRRDRVVVDVIDFNFISFDRMTEHDGVWQHTEWTSSSRKTGKADLEIDASTIGYGPCDNAAANSSQAAVWKCSTVHCADHIVGSDGRVAE